MLNYSSGFREISIPSIDLQSLAERLKILSEPKRLLIFNLLMEGVQCNCELGDALQMPPNLISHHLRILREAGLVTVEKRGVWAWYAPDARGLVWFKEMVARLGEPDAETAPADEEIRLAAAG